MCFGDCFVGCIPVNVLTESLVFGSATEHVPMRVFDLRTSAAADFALACEFRSVATDALMSSIAVERGDIQPVELPLGLLCLYH